MQSLYIDDELNEILVNLEDQFDNHLNMFKGVIANFETDTIEFFGPGIKGFNIYTRQLSEYRNKLEKYS